MLGDCSNLRIDSSYRRARVALQPHLACVALKCAIGQGVGHAGDIASRFGIRKRLVGGGLLKAFRVGEFTKSAGGGGVPQKTEYWVHNAVRIVDVQRSSD
jgi:hypothetical protein